MKLKGSIEEIREFRQLAARAVKEGMTQELRAQLRETSLRAKEAAGDDRFQLGRWVNIESGLERYKESISRGVFTDIAVRNALKTMFE